MIAARPQAAELTFGELRLELMRLLESIVPDLTNDSIARR